ncbi:GNAT family N-acetyltransferase [Alicyclobacillus macrosporangiidus]|uniref:Acetyltransferase (GNAT) family protein n=1 Tax=Alicyclobacillus macrosporangiidus TaxID=392015 RepID=A0A1I7JRZ3_9BACL|nr:GNAT family N-acetyltransferase [Alicyclobacillus macrosporangiidus]SFU87971.1 Acetyltransferase (GNAT) family protein [Alicyclobacillus macrosporangiidus]
MDGRRARRAVLVISVFIAFASFAIWGWRRAYGLAPPLWDEVAMAYGGVFCVFWFFDEISRQASIRRRERARVRPRPSAAASPGQRVVAASGRGTASVRLDRVRPEQEGMLQSLLDDLAEEVWALEGRRPPAGPDGAPLGWSARAWRAEGVHAFFILATFGGEAEELAGMCAVGAGSHGAEIRGIYVLPAWRRSGLGGQALEKLLEFVRLANLGDAASVRLSRNNARAQRFFTKHGFAAAVSVTSAREDEAAAWVTWERPVAQVHPLKWERSEEIAPPGATPR